MVNCLVFSICYVRLCKKWCLQSICLTKRWMMMEIIDKSDCQIIWCLFAGLKPIILRSVHSIWFMKYICFAEIWFVKTSTGIVKHESRVIKLNPVMLQILVNIFRQIKMKSLGFYYYNKLFVFNLVCIPPPPISTGVGGGGLNLQIFKKGGLDRTSPFRGWLLGKRCVTFFNKRRGGLGSLLI